MSRTYRTSIHGGSKMKDVVEGLIGFVVIAIGVIGFVAILSIVFSIPLWLLWNWLMPEIFGVKTILLWQAIGLSCLCSLLFKDHTSSSSSK